MDDDDDELPDGVYHDDLGTEPCPYCGADIASGADYCPRCKNWMSAEETQPHRKPLWVWVLLILAVVMMVATALMGW